MSGSLEEIARAMRVSHMMAIALAAVYGEPGDLAEACDLAEAAILAALRAERERCAKVAEESMTRDGDTIAAAIRGREGDR